MTESSPPQATPVFARFELGQLCYTPGAQAALERFKVNPFRLIGRHLSGDWGDVCAEDAKANEDALIHGHRLLSAYRLTAPDNEGEQPDPVTCWLITEADRSVTTILLPEEY
ncbi:hypothetical protein [Methylosarcina fibrata]|uniref:hypothetical protein n=1 Tax=Methylosarcina fibrata TaxID=105972 RepID=UPI0003A2D40B|nr:hypothetical protein [Methylosarcina fibrata]